MEKKLSVKILDELRNDILNGVYEPRELLSESFVAQKYGVSKAPVKEALHLLCEQGYLISYPRRGYMVNIYSKEEINAMQQIRRCLESECVRLAIRTAGDKELAVLKDIAHDGETSLNPRESVNTRFHMRIAELSGNKYMPEVLEKLLCRVTMGVIKMKPDYGNYENIARAMLERDEEQAVRYLLEDIADV